MLTTKPIAAAIAGVSVVQRMSPSPGNFNSIRQTTTEHQSIPSIPSPSPITRTPGVSQPGDCTIEFEKRISRQRHQLDQFLGHQSAVATPPLPVTNNPYILLGIPLHSDFDAARKAYLHMCKMYHPDRVVGPDCTDQEKKEANWDFSRINSAYDILKRKHDEEVHEYFTHVDGELVTKKVRVAKAERARTTKERVAWHEQDCDNQSRHNGFEPASSFDTYKRGSWWKNDEPEDEIWSSQRHLEYNTRVAQDGFDFKQNHWWEDDHHSSGYGVSQETQRGYQKPRQSMRFQDPMSKAGYPYKDRMWNSAD